MPIFVPNDPGIVVYRRMKADVAFVSSVVSVDLSDLTVNFIGGQTYSFSIQLQCSHTSTGGYGINLHNTAGLTATDLLAGYTAYLGQNGNPTVTSYSVSSAFNADFSSPTLGAGVAKISIEGTLTTNAGGTLTIRGVQDNAAGTSTFKRGSYMKVWGPY